MVGTIEGAVERGKHARGGIGEACVPGTGKKFDVSLVTPDGAAYEGEAR